MGVLEIFSKVVVFAVLFVKACARGLSNCCLSVLSAFNRAKNLKNAEKNITDVHEFMKLVTDDEDDDLPNLLTDEQVKRLVNDKKDDEANQSIEVEDVKSFKKGKKQGSRGRQGDGQGQKDGGQDPSTPTGDDRGNDAGPDLLGVDKPKPPADLLS